MANREIWNEIMIKASLGGLYEALTDMKKLAHWRTTETWGGIQNRGELGICFDRFYKRIEVMTLKPDELIGWHVTNKGLSDWADTEIEFKIFR